MGKLLSLVLQNCSDASLLATDPSGSDVVDMPAPFVAGAGAAGSIYKYRTRRDACRIPI